MWEPDEGRYGLVAWNMVTSGDWFTPRLHGEEHLTKPPFTYWLTAAGMSVFGPNSWGGRLFVGAAYFLTVVAVAGIARTWRWPTARVQWVAFVHATTLLPFAMGHTVTTDPYLACWQALFLWAYWNLRTGTDRAEAWRWLFWVAVGGAFFTKGPPGWLPLVPLIVMIWAAPRPAQAHRIWSLPGIAVAAVIALGWFVAQVIRRPELLEHFLIKETLQRVASDVHERSKPFYIYAVTMLVGGLPWLPYTIAAAKMPVQQWRQSGWSSLNDRQRWAILAWVLPLIIFQASTSRMYYYVGPLFVPMSLAAAWALVPEGAWVPPLFQRSWARLAFCGWLLLLSLSMMWPDSIPPYRGYEALARDIREDLANHNGPVSMVTCERSLPLSLELDLNHEVTGLWEAQIQTHADECTKEGIRVVLLTRGRNFDRLPIFPEDWKRIDDHPDFHAYLYITED